jgi:ferredoxin
VVVVSTERFELAFQVKSTRSVDEAIAAAIELASSDRAVVLAIPRAWHLMSKVLEEASAQGVNPYLIHPLDIEAEPELAGISSTVLASAKAYSLAYTLASRAAVGLSTGKRTDRRSLITRGPLAALAYKPVPVVDPSTCRALRGCNICVKECPESALSGKPPVADERRCSLCGLCLNVCPVEALASTGSSEAQVGAFASRVAEELKDKSYLVLVCQGSVDEASRLIDGLKLAKPQHPIVFYTIAYPGELTFRLSVALGLAGFHVVVLCHSISAVNLRVLGEAAKLGAVVETVEAATDALKLLTKTPESRRAVAKPVLTRLQLARELMARLSDRVETTFPLAAIVLVDEAKCTLCGACSRSCPSNALLLEESASSSKLLFYHDKCIACRMCVDVCPYTALRLSYVLDPSLRGKPVTLAEDEMLRCIVCERPVAPRRTILEVVRRLKASGVSRTALAAVFMCQECKVKYQLGLVEPRRKPPIEL